MRIEILVQVEVDQENPAAVSPEDLADEIADFLEVDNALFNITVDVTDVENGATEEEVEEN